MMVRWLYSAQRQQDLTADYLYVEFGEKVLVDFYQRLDDVEQQLSQFPEMGREERLLQNRSRTYRSLVINKFSKLVYTIDSDCVYIVAFWDTRREPKALTIQLD